MITTDTEKSWFDWVVNQLDKVCEYRELVLNEYLKMYGKLPDKIGTDSLFNFPHVLVPVTSLDFFYKMMELGFRVYWYESEDDESFVVVILRKGEEK